MCDFAESPKRTSITASIDALLDLKSMVMVWFSRRSTLPLLPMYVSRETCLVLLTWWLAMGWFRSDDLLLSRLRLQVWTRSRDGCMDFRVAHRLAPSTKVVSRAEDNSQVTLNNVNWVYGDRMFHVKHPLEKNDL